MSPRKNPHVGRLSNLKYGQEKASEECIIPQDLSPEERENWEVVAAAAAGDMRGFVKDSMRRAAGDPSLRKELLERHREKTRNDAAAGLAGCEKVLALPLETLTTLLSLPEGEVVKLYSAVSVLRKSKLELADEDVRLIRDMAVVIEVMEQESEDDADFVAMDAKASPMPMYIR